MHPRGVNKMFLKSLLFFWQHLLVQSLIGNRLWGPYAAIDDVEEIWICHGKSLLILELLVFFALPSCVVWAWKDLFFKSMVFIYPKKRSICDFYLKKGDFDTTKYIRFKAHLMIQKAESKVGHTLGNGHQHPEKRSLFKRQKQIWVAVKPAVVNFESN